MDWLKIDQETLVYDLLPLNNWNTVDTASNPKQTKFKVFADDKINVSKFLSNVSSKWTKKYQPRQTMQADLNWNFLHVVNFLLIKGLYYSIPLYTILRPSQIQRSCRQQLKCCYIRILRYRLHRKHCGKRWNCSFWAISPFSTMFSWSLFLQCVKMSIHGEKG